MAEKILNTRIQLKYDTLANWTAEAKQFVLKAGEVAIAQVPTVEGSTLQPVMFKVGDGNKTFNQLDWASALAADVYSWAKQSSLPIDTTVAPEGKFVEGFEWKDNKLVPKFREFVGEINESTKEKLDAPTTKAVKAYVDSVAEGIVAQGTVVAAGAKIDVAQSANTYTVSHETVAAPSATAGTGRTYLTGVTTDSYGHITGFTTASEEDQIIPDIEIIEDAEADAPTTATVNVYKNLTAEGHKLTEELVEVATAKGVATAKSEAIAEATRLDGVLKSELQGEIDSDIAAARTAITTEIGQAVAPLATTEALNGVDAKFADYTKTADLPTDLGQFTNNAGYAKTNDVVTNAEFTAFEQTNTQAIATAEQNAKDYADDIKDAILGEGIKDTFDTLVEIQTWIEGAGVNATELTEAIAAEAKIREDADKALSENKLDKTAYNTDKEAQAQKDAAQDEALTDAITAEVQRADGKYATEADLTLAEGRIDTLEKKPGLDKVGTVVSVATGTGLTGGTITESGTIALSDATIASLAKADTALQDHQDISGKADKVADATADNFAGLDEEGNLTDSGFNADSFVMIGDEITIGDHEYKTNISENGVHLSNEDAGNTASFGLTGLSISESENAEDREYFKVGFKTTGDTATGKCDGVEVQGSVGFKTAFNEFLGTEAIAKAAADEVEAKLPTSADYGVLSVTAKDTAEKLSGIKVDNTDAQNPKVEIDDTITWIFNCGGASI